MNDNENNDSSQADEPIEPDQIKDETPTASPQPTGPAVSSTVGNPSANHPPFKDRITGLIVFGILQIFMGGCCVLLIPLMLLSQYVAPAAGTQMNVRMLVPMIGMYAFLAVVLIWLGVGSILARRWARALTLVLAWTWLVIGILAMIMIVSWGPNLFNMAGQDQQVPKEMLVFMQVVMTGTIGCMYLFLPGIFVFFYQSKHVKATCEQRDPHVRWTDKCPLPVLAMSLMLGYGSLSFFYSASYGFVTPFFGILLKGIPGGIVMLPFTLLSAYLAWATYQLKIAAWWTTLAVYVTFGVSGIITFSRIDLMDLYREMNMPEDQLKFIEKSGMIDRMNMPLIFGMSFVVFVGYLLWVRRYFIASSDESRREN
ncbi:MAG: hypothetical protein K0U86_17695 [Planctomycetes bacterium]|nr:hypothetical protein [Planctomycetota bacterium]MCH9726740.1 hypothetical protein [Planctomycetota bacterium]MCH9779648.1 hypothetical protein [Planctomycetota bacterium]MCH9789260.1 hypothetical protein [Planctomycetota bacterium]